MTVLYGQTKATFSAPPPHHFRHFRPAMVPLDFLYDLAHIQIGMRVQSYLVFSYRFVCSTVLLLMSRGHCWGPKVHKLGPFSDLYTHQRSGQAQLSTVPLHCHQLRHAVSRVPPLLSKWISPSFGGWIACFVGVDVQKWDPVRDCLVEVWWPHAQRKATLPTLPLYHPASNDMVGAVVMFFIFLMKK